MKHLLIVDNNFYPELSSLAQIYTDLCTELSKYFKVTVICATPSYTGKTEEKYEDKWIYQEIYKSIYILRVRVSAFDKNNKMSRVKSIVGYFFNTIRALKYVQSVDLILAVSQPPIIGGVIGTIAKYVKHCKYIYNIQDFNPEQISAVGYSKNRVLLKMLQIIDKWSCKCADSIIVVGKDMVNTINSRFNKSDKVPRTVFINNWVDENVLYPLSNEKKEVIEFKRRYGIENKIVFMYSGNIGLIYDLDNLLKVFAKYSDKENLAFCFVGEGNMKYKLQKYSEKNHLCNVFFIPYQDNDKIIYSLNAADVHFVVNARGMKGVACPSKLYGVMAVGKPVFGVLETGTEAREIIEESKCGYVVEPGDYKSVEELLDKFLKMQDFYNEMGLAGRRYLEKNLCKLQSIEKYIKEITYILEIR